MRTIELKQAIKIALHQLHSLIQSENQPNIKYAKLDTLSIDNSLIQDNPVQTYFEKSIVLVDANLKKEKNSFMPDFSVNVFNGTNNYPNSDNYFGYQLGIGLPLLSGGQRSKLKAEKLSVKISENLRQNFNIKSQNNLDALKLELQNAKIAIDTYNNSGSELADEIIKVAEKKYFAGDINFVNFSQSIENATEIKLNYLDNLTRYNSTVLEINYITK